MFLLPVWLLFLLICDSVDWQSFFNTRIDRSLLHPVLKWTVTAFCLQLLLQPVNAFLMATHRHYLAGIISLTGNLLAIGLIIMLGGYFDASLLFLSIALSLPPVVCLVGFSVFLFSGKYANFKPHFKLIRFGYRKKLFKLGFKFFLIQIAGLVIFASNNFVISTLEGNESVAEYNVVLKFFSSITLFQSLILAPIWTGYTDAYTLTDYNWIRKVIRKINLLSWGLCIMLLLMVLFANSFYKIWINKNFSASDSLNLLMGISVGISLFATNYTIFINGTGKLRLQTYLSVLVGFLHIPLAYLLMRKLKMGVNGLVVLNIVWMSLSLVLWSVQYRKILSNSTSKFWNS
jgi:O-antigen/teichoic acid export membrane protein